VRESAEHDDGADERDDKQSVAAAADDGDRVRCGKRQRKRGENEGRARLKRPRAGEAGRRDEHQRPIEEVISTLRGPGCT